MATNWFAPAPRALPMIKGTFDVDGQLTASAIHPGVVWHDFSEYSTGAVTTLDKGLGHPSNPTMHDYGASPSRTIETRAGKWGGTTKGLRLKDTTVRFPVPWAGNVSGGWARMSLAILMACEDTGANIDGELWWGFCNTAGNNPMDASPGTTVARRIGDAAMGVTAPWTRATDSFGYVYYAAGGRNVYRSGGTTTYANSSASQFHGLSARDNGHATLLRAEIDWRGASLTWAFITNSPTTTDMGKHTPDFYHLSRLGITPHIGSLTLAGGYPMTSTPSSYGPVKNVTGGELDAGFLSFKNISGSAYIEVYGIMMKLQEVLI